MKKKILKAFAILIIVMTFGWIGSLFFGRYLTPILIRNDFFAKMGIFENDDKSTTIINKTERVLVRESDSVTEVSSNAIYAVVDVFSFSVEAENKTVQKSLAMGEREKFQQGKSGAGTILTNDGLIVTSRFNIIEEAAEYKILTYGGNVLEAKLLGVDDFTDLAFLKAEGSNFTTMPMADSSTVNFGKRVVIIGEISGSQKIYLSDGVLSGFDEKFSLTGTEIASSEKLQGVLRVDFVGGEDYAGGPIINYSGELLGISIFINKGGEKQFFQIPINVVKDSMQKISENRLDKTARLGIYYLSLDAYYKILKDLKVERGALIYSATGKQGLAVIAESSAEKAGLKIGDIIMSIDGNEIDSAHPLSNFISQYEKDSTAVLKVLRGDEEIELTVEF
ncbi:MAG: trypsin-like peptidase domain-containing protein [Candidatus Moraniibacteriota bacterium]